MPKESKGIPIPSIACVSYESSGSNLRNTVGVCVFAVSGTVTFSEDDRNYLKTRTIDFYNKFHNEKLTPLANYRILETNATSIP
jgi:hypothetical protein